MSRDGNNSSQSAGALLEELSECCRSESLSEDGLRVIIEKHGIASNNNDPNINNYEFFHWACCNARVTEGILRCVLEYFPNAVRCAAERGQLPIHVISRNKNVTLNMVQLLIDAFPDSLRHETNNGWLPLHQFCNRFDEQLDRYPESVRHLTRRGNLPIHYAAACHSPEFCRILIEAHPGSERITDDIGMIPFHHVCLYNTVATVEYLYQLYPESINVANNKGYYPIHFAIQGVQFRGYNPEFAIGIVQFLINCDPNVVLQELEDKLPLYWACGYATNETPRLNAALKVLHILYDAHPEAIESNEITSNIRNFRQREVQAFINTQLTYARQARDRTIMTTRDENGQFPLHKALLSNDITLGSIKLLVKGNPSAVQTPDNGDALPLHLASQRSESDISISIVKYLLGLDPTPLGAVDVQGNTALHYACRGAKHKMIVLLTKTYGAVSKQNAHNQLPLHLLLESPEVSDREGMEYTDSIFRLIRAYPETVMRAQSEHATVGQKRRFSCLQG